MFFKEVERNPPFRKRSNAQLAKLNQNFRHPRLVHINQGVLQLLLLQEVQVTGEREREREDGKGGGAVTIGGFMVDTYRALP